MAASNKFPGKKVSAKNVSAKTGKTGRLKVFMTQIGFHNWLVAAPSQKAALAAWGVKENLFAMGAARIVTDKTRVELAMRMPGVSVAADAQHAFAKASKVLRLDDHRAGRKPRAEQPKKRPNKSVARPKKADRSKLDRAEQAIEDFKKRAVHERAALTPARRALDLKAEMLEADLDDERERLEGLLKKAQERYDAQTSG